MRLPRLAFAMACAAAVGAAPAWGAPALADVQAAIVKKVIAYDRALDQRADLLVLVLGDKSNRTGAEEAAAAFRRVGLEAELADEGGTPSRLRPGVILFLVSAPSPALLEAAAHAGSLTVASDPELAVRGKASVGLRRKIDGRTEILINVARARAERHDFSSYLLTISTILK